MSLSQLRPSLSGQHLYTSPAGHSSSSHSTQAGPSYETHLNSPNEVSSSRSRRLKSFRPWSFSRPSSQPDRPGISGEPSSTRSGNASTNGMNGAEYNTMEDMSEVLRSYSELRVRDIEPPPPSSRRRNAPPPPPPRPWVSTKKDWSSSDEDDITDGYSYSDWVDPSEVGSANLRRTPLPRRISSSEPPSPSGTASRAIRQAIKEPLRVPPSPTTAAPQRPGFLDARESYSLLLAYQSSTSSHHSSNSHNTPTPPVTSPAISTERVQAKGDTPDPEWHDLVDPSLRQILERSEVKRQGLWWELIKGEAEYVKDLRVICRGFIEPLKLYDPPLLTDEVRLHAFIQEVFSSIPDLLKLHEEMLERLLERQRSDWPLLTSATDILLRTFIEAVLFYEAYMKNFPFAETRIRRECRQNPRFALFLQDRRNDTNLTRRRDLSVFLSRPVTRLPRTLLLLDAILAATPQDHPDQTDLPTVRAILQDVLKGSQPGIETAEAKIKLWDFGETLMFRRGEIIELDFPEPKRTLVHAGYVFRRMRSETNWHGWQDLHAFLLDNYFLLTRDEEQGKHIVVSRPIHIDFLEIVAADGVPERRHDYINQVRRRSTRRPMRDGNHELGNDRLMYPFTVALRAGNNSRTYTLCVTSQVAREQWKEKIDHAKSLRRFDVENNRTYAVHTINIPPDITSPLLLTADTFTWLNRQTVAVASGRSVYMGWRRDRHTYRELVRFSGPGGISHVSVIPDFGWLLVVFGGSLIAFDLKAMIPTHEPSTWMRMIRGQGVELSPSDQQVALVRVGTTKGRLLVLHAAYNGRANATLLTFEEPLHAAQMDNRDPRSAFRRFAQMSVPGFASEVSFFRQTIAIVTEKTFLVAEPGNISYNTIPTIPGELAGSSLVVRLAGQTKPMAMYQTGENEFLLVYDWGACFTTRYGEISRGGAFMRWNVIPTYAAYRPPHLLLFDEEGGRAEVRLVQNGKMCEVIEWKGMKPLRLTRADQAMLAISPNDLIEVVETVPL